MIERTAVADLIRSAYAARHRGDLDGLMSHFHEECSYRLAGGPEACEVFVQPDGRAAVREQMAGLIATYVFSNIEELALMVEGDRATLHWRADVVCLPTGRTGSFEIMDLITVADGKVASVTQFTDTAGVARLSV